MPSDTPDVSVAIAAGLAITGVIFTPVVAAVRVLVGGDATPLTAIIGGSAAIVLATYGFHRLGGDVPVRIGRTTWSVLLLLVPASFVVAIPVLSPPQATWPVLLLGGAFGVVTTAIFILASQTRHANTVTPEDPVSWAGKAPDSVATRHQQLAGTTIALGIVLFVGGLWFHAEPVRLVGQWLVPAAAAGLASSTRIDTFEAGPTHLTRRQPVHSVARPWSRYRGYAVHDDEIAIYRKRRSRWLGTIHLARDELDDEDAVIEVLDRQLPEVTNAN